MFVNSINNVNNSSSYAKNPSFKKVIPAKLFVNDNPASSDQMINRAFKEFYRILRKPKNSVEDSIRTEFIRTVQDYKIHTRPNKQFITSSSIDGKFYIFTGSDAEELAKYSDEIGYAQKEGLDRCDTSTTYEAKTKKKEYFDKVKKLISSKSRLNEIKELKDGHYGWGDELGIHIKAKAEGSIGKKGFKFEILSAPFRHIKKEVPQANQAPQPKPVASVPVKKRAAKKGKTADWPARTESQKSDMPKGPDFLNFD